jgi:hypothetical protein
LVSLAVLQFASIMGIIEDTGLVGQQYSELYSSFRHNKIFSQELTRLSSRRLADDDLLHCDDAQRAAHRLPRPEAAGR